MSKTNEGGAEDEVILDELPDDVEEGQEDKTDWKAIAKKNHGIAKRFQTKFEKAKSKETPEAKPGEKGVEVTPKADGLDRMDKAILRMEKITSENEVALVESFMKETGKDLESVLGSKFFQAELKEMRDLAATEEATPTGSKRSGVSTRDTVDYWIAKGELPPASNPELRTKVVNAKIAKEKAGNQFSSNPIQ